MFETFPQIFFLLVAGVFLSTILMHLVKKNVTLISLYLLQSVALSVILFMVIFKEHKISLFLAAFLTLVVKTVVAPRFFFKLIKKHGVTFTASTYFNTPLTLLLLTALTAFAHSGIFSPLVSFTFQKGASHTPLILSSIFISFFLIINRKGALSQSIGMLSLENGIMVLASFLELKQSLALELGIIFDTVVWIFIATVFMSTIYRQFGSLEITTLKYLKEE